MPRSTASGRARSRKWILVDCRPRLRGRGAAAGRRPDVPGHPLHRGASARTSSASSSPTPMRTISAPWPSCGRGCRVPVYATRFALGLLEARRLGEPGAPKVELREIAAGQRIAVGPFDGRVRAGRPFDPGIERARDPHARSGSSSIPATGSSTTRLSSAAPTSEAAFRAARRRGRPGARLRLRRTSCARDAARARAEVAKRLAEIIAASPARVAVTTFASNVARIRAVADAAQACGREVVVVGRAMDRVIEVARECGYLDGLPEFRPPDAYGYLPRDKVVALLTGIQGEPRAALARIAEDEHPEITLSKGDRVIFSSRAIPGNEKAIGAIINMPRPAGDRGHHRPAPTSSTSRAIRAGTSSPRCTAGRGRGSPCRRMARTLHLAEHAAASPGRRACPRSCAARNGTVVRLAPGRAEIIDDVPVGRLYKDGDIVIDAGRARRAGAAQARLRRHRLGRDRDRRAAARSPATR